MDRKKIIIDSAAFGLDANIKQKAEGVSASLYNRGLRLAQANDLTGAIVALEKSLEFSKNGIQARNLLGLCYYAVGRLGDALAHWLISQAYQKDDNLANAYIADVRDNQKYTDKINHSIVLYNSALDFCKGGSADMAIIRLKKCVELNPVFVDALCLLALGYLSTGRPQNAEQYVRKALQIDPFNPVALSYYAEITGVTRPAPRKRGTGKPNLMDVRGYAKPENKRNIVNDFHISEIISFLIGCGIVAIVFFFLIRPDLDEKYTKKIEALSNTITLTRAAGELALAQKDEQYKDVDELILSLTNQVSELEWALGLSYRQFALQDAQAYFDAGDYYMSYTVAVENGPEGFTPEQAETHARLLHDSAAAIESIHYSDAKKAYDKNDFAGAKWDFSVALRYSQTDSPHADSIYYYLGRIAEREGDNTLACEYYEKVFKEYPGSTHSNDSSTRYNRLK